MQIANEFRVEAPIERVWAHLLDVERVAPCMPGAQLTEVVDDRTWKGRANVKLGPVSLSFAGTLVMAERDESVHRVVLKAEGREQRGKGAASATITSVMQQDGDGTRVAIDTDLTITGAVAQYGRGMIQDISARLTQQFAECLRATIAAEEAAPVPVEAVPPGGEAAPAVPLAPAPPQPVAAPAAVGGVRLGLWALWRALVRLLRRLFGGGRG